MITNLPKLNNKYTAEVMKSELWSYIEETI